MTVFFLIYFFSFNVQNLFFFLQPEEIKYNDDTPIEDQELDSSNNEQLLTQLSFENPKEDGERSEGVHDFKPTMAEYNVVKSRLNQIARKDPLYHLTREDKNLLWYAMKIEKYKKMRIC